MYKSFSYVNTFILVSMTTDLVELGVIRLELIKRTLGAWVYLQLVLTILICDGISSSSVSLSSQIGLEERISYLFTILLPNQALGASMIHTASQTQFTGSNFRTKT